MPDLLTRSFTKGNALLYRSGHGAGQLGLVVPQGIIAARHRLVAERFQIAQFAQLADHSLADLRDDGGNVGIAAGIDLDKLRLEVLGRVIEVDPL